MCPLFKWMLTFPAMVQLMGVSLWSHTNIYHITYWPATVLWSWLVSPSFSYSTSPVQFLLTEQCYCQYDALSLAVSAEDMKLVPPSSVMWCSSNIRPGGHPPFVRAAVSAEISYVFTIFSTSLSILGTATSIIGESGHILRLKSVDRIKGGRVSTTLYHYNSFQMKSTVDSHYLLCTRCCGWKLVGGTI